MRVNVCGSVRACDRSCVRAIVFVRSQACERACELEIAGERAGVRKRERAGECVGELARRSKLASVRACVRACERANRASERIGRSGVRPVSVRVISQSGFDSARRATHRIMPPVAPSAPHRTALSRSRRGLCRPPPKISCKSMAVWVHSTPAAGASAEAGGGGCQDGRARLPLLCGEVPVEAKRVESTVDAMRGAGQRWRRSTLGGSASHGCSGPGSRPGPKHVAGQRAAGQCCAKLGRGARIERPARLSLAPPRLALRSAVVSSSEPRAGSQPADSGGGESYLKGGALISARSLTCVSRVTVSDGPAGPSRKRQAGPLLAHLMPPQRVCHVSRCSCARVITYVLVTSDGLGSGMQMRHATRIAAGRWVKLGRLVPDDEHYPPDCR